MTADMRASPAVRVPGRGATFRLLDADPDLSVALGPDDLRVARCAVRTLHRLIPEGPWAGVRAETPEALVAVVLDGFLLRCSTVSGRTAGEVLGPGDVIVPCASAAEDLRTTLVSWSALSACGLAILDATAMRRAGRWPEIVTELLRRAGARASRLAREDAIRRTPRIEERLLALLAELAGRWGRVTPGGIVLDVPLTHEVLSQLAGAQRPTVTTALKALRRRGILSRRPDRRWVLAADSTLVDPTSDARDAPPVSRMTPAGVGSHLAPAGTVR